MISSSAWTDKIPPATIRINIIPKAIAFFPKISLIYILTFNFSNILIIYCKNIKIEKNYDEILSFFMVILILISL